MKNKLRVESKQIKEERIVTEMILLYCRKNHKDGLKEKGVCLECKELCDYAVMRSRNCRYMEHKTFCANCKTPCYKPKMKEKIRTVMKFSGPRMLFFHPIMAIYHLICTVKEKRKSIPLSS